MHAHSSGLEHALSDSVGFALAQLCGGFRAHVDAALRELGLFVGQEQALLHLWKQDGLTQKELVERMRCSPATISNMVGRLEASSLIVRERDAQDARLARLHLSDAGRALEEPVRRLWDEAEAQLMAGFTVEERLLLRRLLLQARANLR
jgi:DNA-binding MarR family transcriptional regulator